MKYEVITNSLQTVTIKMIPLTTTEVEGLASAESDFMDRHLREALRSYHDHPMVSIIYSHGVLGKKNVFTIGFQTP